MSGAARKIAYQRHEYSGVRKSSKRAKSALKRIHGVDSRMKVWRSEEMKKKLMNKQSIRDNSIVTQNTQLRTYARVKPKIRLEATYSVPSTGTVMAEPVNELSMREKQRAQNDIKVFCPKCNSEVSHTAEGIQLDQTKIIVAKVYHYFEQEYELKKTIEGIDQTPLSIFRQWTARATGVSETTVEEILQEEARRNEEMRQQTLLQQSLARKRPRQTDSSIEDGSSDENIADNDNELILLEDGEIKMEQIEIGEEGFS